MITRHRSGRIEPLERRTLFAGISVSNVELIEADAGTSNADLRLTLSEPAAAPVTIDFSTADGTAIAKADYVATSGTLTFTAGATQLTLSIPVVGDVLTEDAETFVVNFTNATNATLDTSQATLTVQDNEQTGGIEAIDDLFVSSPTASTTLNVLANDFGLTADATSLSILTQPANGVVTINSDNTITYTPSAGSPAIDTFAYRVASGVDRSIAGVKVVPAGAQTGPDLLDPSLTALFVAGDANNNSVKFRKRAGRVQVLVDKVDRGTFDIPTGHIVIFGGEGNDKLSVAGLRSPLCLYGGAGDDTLVGGRFSDVLVGGEGNDALAGSAGRDLLIGGAGADALNGAADEDILIAGISEFDADSDKSRAAIRDLMAEWNADSLNANRMANLQAPAGLGTSGIVLNTESIHDDAEADAVTGVFGQDALFANTIGENLPDTLRGKRINGNGIGVVGDLVPWSPSGELLGAVSAQTVGTTPQQIGFNQGYYLPGSSTSGWVDYSQLNAFRVWTSPGDFEPDDSETFGDAIQTLEDFEARKAAVSADPEGNGFIPWDIYNDRFENLEISGRNTSKLNYMLGELRDRGVTIIMQITRSESYPFVGWDGAWEQWQHFYAMAYHAAKNYDVTRFQMYNEPDQTNATITQDEWRARLKLASDAVRTAILDVNRDFGKNLVPDMSAPVVKLGAESVLTWDTPGSVDWGKQALETNRIDYAGRTVDYDIFNTYDMHRYADSRPLSWYTDDGAILRSEIPQYNASGEMMPFTYTEYNRRTTAGFNNRPTETLDTPLDYTEFGLINLLTMEQGVTGLYAFKFNQTDFSGSPQKTGFYYVTEEDVLDTTGATRAAGVQRLFAKGFKDGLPRVATADPIATYESAASFHPATNDYSYMGINLSDTDTASFTIDLNEWNVPAGSVVSIEEVSESHHGEVVQKLTVPASGKIDINQPARSVWLLTIPSGTPQQSIVLAPTEDAQVHNGDESTHGEDTTAFVARSATDAVGDYATYLKFDLGSLSPSDVSRAILDVTGRNTSSADSTLFHVYALTDDNWSESSITWSTAPNLFPIDAKMTGVGTTATPVGHLTFNGSTSTTGIDLTEYVRKHGDGILTLALVREQRFAGDADGNVVEINTSESAAGPKLTLLTEGNA